MNGGFKKLLVVFRNGFLAGMAVLLPLWVTVVVVRFLVSWINHALLNPVASILRTNFGWADVEPVLLAIKILVFFAIICGIALLGMAMRILVVRQLVQLGERILLKIPFIRNIYRAMQQLSHTFLIKKQNVFNRVVLIQYPRLGLFAIGFVTSESRGEIQNVTEKNVVYVFVPTTPNPTSGVLVMVPQDDIVPLSMTVEDGLKLVISGGAITPELSEEERG